jgi:integrase
MTRSTGQRRFHFKNTTPTHPAVKHLRDWLPANVGFYADFRRWLKGGGYGDSTLNIYGVAARLALGLLDKPYWLIDPQVDLEQVRTHIATHFSSKSTCGSYFKGLAKLAQYLYLRCHRPEPKRSINWNYYLDSLPTWLAKDVRAYIVHCRRAWVPEQQYRATVSMLSSLTRSLRWMAAHTVLASNESIAPAVWFDYVDARLKAGTKPATLNAELSALQNYLYFLVGQGSPICQRMLRVDPLAAAPRLPRDIPPGQLYRLLQEIKTDAASPHAGLRRMGLMDHAWFLLMLCSGLRVGEVRRLRLADLDLEGQRVRIEQSKGLKDRIVYLTQAAVDALRAYLEVRGPSEAAEDHVFLYRHLPLGSTYCNHRLRTYGKRCNVFLTAHQLRHSCATLLLNAGTPILTIQTILGHKHIDTTLGYARLYDSTVAADYYQAITQIESHLALEENPTAVPLLSSGELLTLVDSLHNGTLNEAQRKTVQALRTGILALAERETEHLNTARPLG